MIGARPLTPDEIQTITLRLKTQRDTALFILNLYTGFRIQETLSLRVRDVLTPQLDIRDRISVERKNMKGKVSSRSVILHETAKDALRTLIAADGLGPDDYLFTSNKGGPISRVQAWRTLRDASVGLGDNISLHSTRKTFAKTVHALGGNDLVKTARALGHRSVLSTMSYLSFQTEEVDSLIKGMK